MVDAVFIGKVQETVLESGSPDGNEAYGTIGSTTDLDQLTMVSPSFGRSLRDLGISVRSHLTNGSDA